MWGVATAWGAANLGQLRVGLAAGFGGGSLIYANVHLRPPEEAFAGEWPRPCPRRRACAAAGRAGRMTAAV